jgi:hypothetical protein
LVRKSEIRRAFGRSSLWWEDNIEMDLEVVGWEGVE